MEERTNAYKSPHTKLKEEDGSNDTQEESPRTKRARAQKLLEEEEKKQKEVLMFMRNDIHKDEDDQNEESKVAIIDSYGFLLDEKDNINPSGELSEKSKKEKMQEMKKQNARMEKWRIMLLDFPAYRKKNSNKLKERIRKGIPECFRGLVWQIFAKTKEKMAEYPEVYEQLIEIEKCKYEKTIMKDINRTFPKHIFFKTKYGEGQKTLFNVLKALSLRFPETGYVQGMGFMSALLLTYMGDKEAFWTMVNIMENYNMKGFFLNKMPELSRALYRFMGLFKKYLSKLYAWFEKNELTPQMYATNWFITNFTATFPYPLLIRIWDCYLCENDKILYRIPLALLKLKESQLLKMSFQNIMNFFQSPWDGFEIEQIMKIAHSFTFPRKKLKELDEEYSNNLKPELKQLCQLN